VRSSSLNIQIKTPEQLVKMRAAGLVVNAALERMRAAVAPGVSTADLDAIAEATIREHGAIPSFKGYHGFPGSICSSVNEEIVHAIPSAKSVLVDGDVISLDCGAILDGWHGDAAITVGVGEIKPELVRMAKVAEDSMWAGIAAAARGAASGRGRLTDISHAIETSALAAGRYGIVAEYTGHGIGTEMHQMPHVPNYGRPGRGPRLEPGLVLAVEPMLNLGTRHTRQLEDGWTVVTADGARSAHFEHTFTLTASGPWVLTAVDGGAARLAALGATAATG
jgi:methionyl aminopeptidase